MEIPVLKDNDFKFFQDLIFQLAGLSMSAAKKPLVGNRLVTRLRYYELRSYEEYVHILRNPHNDAERQIFIDLLTTNETSFFREPIHFDFMKSHILNQDSLPNPFRVWSAACSSGEEPYSIAMLLEDKIRGVNWELLASDISSRVLEKIPKGTLSD